MSVTLALPTHEQVQVDIEATTTVKDLADAAKSQLDIKDFQLSFNNEVLHDRKVLLGNLGVADGDVIQVVLDKASEAKMMLTAMGLPLDMPDGIIQAVKTDNVAAVQAYEDAGIHLACDINLRLLCYHDAMQVFAYLLEYENRDKFIWRQSLGDAIGACNLYVFKKLRDLGVTGMVSTVSALKTITGRLHDANKIAEFLELITNTHNETREEKMHCFVAEFCYRRELDEVIDEKITELLSKETTLHSTAYLTAITYERYNWADAMLHNCERATMVKLHKFYSAVITPTHIRYIDRLLEVGTLKEGSANAFVTKLLQSEMPSHVKEFAQRLLGECYTFSYAKMGERLNSAENLHVLLASASTSDRVSIIQNASLRLCRLPHEVEVLRKDKLLHELGSKNLRKVISHAVKGGEVESLKVLLQAAREEKWISEIPSKDCEEDPLYASIRHARKPCTELLFKKITEYSSWVYRNGVTPVEAVINEKKKKQLPMFSLVMKHFKPAVPLAQFVTCAVKQSRPEILKELITRYGAPVDFRLPTSETLLQLSITMTLGYQWKGDVQTVLRIVAEHAKGSCATKDSSGCLPWETALYGGVQKLLLEKADQYNDYAL